MTLRIPAKVLLHVWSYDFYEMTLSTGKQRRHMINGFTPKSIFHSYGNESICRGGDQYCGPCENHKADVDPCPNKDRTSL